MPVTFPDLRSAWPECRAIGGARQRAAAAMRPASTPPARRAPRTRLRIAAPGPRRHVEPVIGASTGAASPAAEPADTGRSSASSASSSRVPCRNSIGTCDVGQVRRALDRRLAGRVQREAEEDQPAHARQRRRGLRLRGHPPAERLAAGEQRQSRRQPRRRRTAARTAAWASAGGPAGSSRAPCTETGSAASRRRARRAPRRRRAMNGCVIPAPAPCASTQQATALCGRHKRPETRCALSTSMLTTEAPA